MSITGEWRGNTRSTPMPLEIFRTVKVSRALPPRQRVAVVHRHVLDRPYDEIAELMGSSEPTARANVYQGTKRLRELMA